MDNASTTVSSGGSWKAVLKNNFKSTRKKMPKLRNMLSIDIRKPLYIRNADRIDPNEDSVSDLESASSNDSSTTSDEEFNSLANQVRRRLSALAYKVQLRKDTFKDEHSAKDIISVIEKRLQAKKEKEDEEDLEDRIPSNSHKGPIIILFCLAFLVLAHIGAAIYCFTHPDRYENPYTCLTPNCKRTSASFTDAMDTSVNPCDDFYLYVCGQFIARNPPETLGENVQLSFVDGIPYQYDGNIKLGMLLKPVKKYPANQVLPFYKSCIHQKRRDQLGFKPFRDLLARLGLLNPHRNITDEPNISRLIARTYKSTGKSFLIEVIEIIHDYVAIGIPKPPSEFKKVDASVYADTMRKALRLMQKELLIRDDEELDVIVYYVMRFEAELYVMQANSLHPLSPVEKIFGFPDEMIKYMKVPKGMHPKFQLPVGTFSWTDFIDEYFVRDPNVAEKSTVFFNYLYSMLNPNDRTNILILEQLLKRTPFYIICRYFQWGLIKEFNDDLTSELQVLMSRVLPSKGLKDTERCFRSLFANLNVLAAERFIMDMADFNTVNHKMTKVLNVIMTGLVNMTLRLPEEFHEWMLENFSSLKVTYSMAPEDSKNIPGYYAGLNVSEKLYFSNVIQARSIKARNDIYRVWKMPQFQNWPLGDFSLNDITMTSIQEDHLLKFLHVPFGGLKEPYVGNDLPILDFGGFGYWVVSFYVMYHTISDMLQFFALERELYEPLETVMTEKIMEMVMLPRLECIQAAFNKIELREVPGQKLNHKVPYIHLQMFADALAVEVLSNVLAMNRKNREIFPRHQLLIGFESYSPEKLLFHSIARQSCVSAPESVLRYQMNHGPIPYHLRINGAFRLSPIFSKTWGCPRNSFMNYGKKCEFFEPYRPPVTDWEGKEPPSVE